VTGGELSVCADLLQSLIAAHPEVWDEDVGE
jgi:hypothetical protein